MLYRRSFLLVGDTVIFLFSTYAGILIVINQDIIQNYLWEYSIYMLFSLGVTITIFYLNKLYHRLWRFVSLIDLFSIIKATTISSFIIYGIYSFSYLLYDSPVKVTLTSQIVSWFILTAGVGFLRLSIRLLTEKSVKLKPFHKKTLIIGAGSAGALVAKELIYSPKSTFYPLGFIDDNPLKAKAKLLGIPLLGTRDDIEFQVKKLGVEVIIIAIPSARREEIFKILEICKRTNSELKIVPSLHEIIHGKITVNMIREVKLEDLLRRDPIKLDITGISGYIQDKIVLVTGAGGSIGSELCRQISSFKPKKVLLLGHGENSIYEIEKELKTMYSFMKYETIIADIQDYKRLVQIFEKYKPNVVFHAAAHKHVPLMELNPAEAVKNNVFGTRNVAVCSHKYNIERFVFISTDKAVNPTSIMGATKRVAEMIIQQLNTFSKTKFVAVRFGNVLGSRGSVVLLFKQQIKNGGPVTVTDPEMVRYFMTIPEAVQLVIEAGGLVQGGEIFVLDMGRPVKIVDLARDLIKLSGLVPDEDIKIKFTGIRPGEKLYEELLTAEEGSEATKNNLILIAKPVHFDKKKFLLSVEQLEQLILEDRLTHEYEIRDLLKQIVPTFNLKDV